MSWIYVRMDRWIELAKRTDPGSARPSPFSPRQQLSPLRMTDHAKTKGTTELKVGNGNNTQSSYYQRPIPDPQTLLVPLWVTGYATRTAGYSTFLRSVHARGVMHA